MEKVFITLTGTKYYFGNDFLKQGMKLRLEKEPDNDYDKEAIKVTYDGVGKIGYVANSPYTVIGESISAGRLYDKIGDHAYAKVVLVTSAGTICKVCKKSFKIRRGIFGEIKHYDADGRKISESRPGIFGGWNHYDD